MAEEKMEVRDVNYRQLFPWTELFRGFQVALDLKKLLLAAAGIVAMAFGWWLLAVLFYNANSQPRWSDDQATASARGEPEEKAWKRFKIKRRQYDLLYEAAGPVPRYPDIGDLAESPQEYNQFHTALGESRPVEFERAGTMYRVDATKDAGGQHPVYTSTDGGLTWVLLRPAYGTLRTWPFYEDRGPNPYLLVTGDPAAVRQARTDPSFFRYLVEPLVKFLRPIVYFLNPNAGFWEKVYFGLVIVWTLVVWGFFGGMITRMASVQVARKEKIDLGEAFRFTRSHYLSFLSAPLFPLVFLLVIMVFEIVFGFFNLIGWGVGDVIDAIFWPLILIAGLVMAVILVGLVGWPMMYATISSEGSDSFDALSRSYSYVYQAPWHYLWYGFWAIAYGALVVFFVGFMGSLLVYLGKWGVAQTPGAQRLDRDPSYLFVNAPESFGWRELLLQGATTADGRELVNRNGAIDPVAYDAYLHQFRGYNYIGAWVVTGWIWLVFLMVIGFGYSYFWSASTIIYLLMRRKVEDTELDEVYLEEDESEEAYAPPVPPPAASPSPAATGPSLTMVEAPTLKPSPAPAQVATYAPPRTESTPPGGGDGNPPSTSVGP